MSDDVRFSDAERRRYTTPSLEYLGSFEELTLTAGGLDANHEMNPQYNPSQL